MSEIAIAENSAALLDAALDAAGGLDRWPSAHSGPRTSWKEGPVQVVGFALNRRRLSRRQR
jgi:hypothetical protein